MNKEERRAYDTKYYAAHREKRRAQQAKYRTEHREVGRANYLNGEHGVSLEGYDALLEKQGGRCAVCGTPPNERRRLSIDHNHESGKVRGLLCTNCNLGLGKFGDSPEILIEASAYLRGSA